MVFLSNPTGALREDEPITRTTFLARLELAITSGELSEGTKLPPERDLASMYGISRSVVREGLRTLIDRKLIEVRPGKGTFVRTPRPMDSALSIELFLRRHQPTPRQLVEARMAIEGQAAALAASRATAEDRAAIRAELEACAASTALLDQTRHDIAFHFSIARAARNPVIETIFGAMAGLTVELMLRSLTDVKVMQRAVPLHTQIADAIDRGDAEAARDAMTRHLSGGDIAYGEDFDRPLDAVAQHALHRLFGSTVSLEDLLAYARVI